MLNRGQNELRGNGRTYEPKKKYQITLCSMMQSAEEAAAPTDFPSSAKWISDYGWGKLRRYSSVR